MPLRRLWCLYEVAQTHALNKDHLGRMRLEFLMPPLITRGEVEAIIMAVDVQEAECYDVTAEAKIRANINKVFRSEEALTNTLILLLTKRLRESVQSLRHP